MHPAEVFHRIGEHVVLARLRCEHRFAVAWPKKAAQLNDFQFCRKTRDQLPPLCWNFDPNDDEVRQLLQGHWPALGFPWKWEPDSHLWNHAPDTGKAWPIVFFGSIPYHAGNPFGDIRVAWEPSRLQQLVSLALLVRRDSGKAGEAVNLVENVFTSWVEENTPLTGIHYISSMECALRLIAACHALDLIRTRLTTPVRTWRSLLQLVQSHAPFIAKRLSLYSSAGNHTIAEGCGLLYAGMLFPEFSEALDWKTVGIRILEQESARQVLLDGGGIEQAIGYQRFILDLLGLAAALLEHHGESVPTTIANAVRNGRKFLHALKVNQTQLPAIGDYDGGYALSRYLQINLDGLEDRSLAKITFLESGYTIFRGCSSAPVRLVLDHGNLGMSPCFAHGHADALSVNLYCGEQEILIDPGTYTYSGDPAWRSYFRGTRAHNTVVVDGLDQAVQETAFMWSHPFHAQLVYASASPDDVGIIIAKHDGYEDRLDVIHWRAVAYEPEGHWIILDCLSGPGCHHLELNWHLALDPTSAHDRHTIQSDWGLLHLHIDGGTTTLHKGDIDPISGWHSTKYGKRESITTLRTTFTGTLPHEFLTQIQLDGVGPSTQLLTTLSFIRRLIHEAQAH